MLELIPDLPDNVVGVRAVGDVEDDDYEDVLVPAVEAALAGHDKIRLLYVLGAEYEGFEPGAMWEDTKLGARTLGSYERIAVVTDGQWIRRAVKAFGWMIPGEVRVFPLAGLAAATDWVGE
jgi:hypothetical protein